MLFYQFYPLSLFILLSLIYFIYVFFLYLLYFLIRAYSPFRLSLRHILPLGPLTFEMLNTTTGLPWLDSPVMLHSSRKDVCMLTAEQCAYRSGYWRYWYQANHVYGRNTIYFMCSVCGVFAVARLWNRMMASTIPRTTSSSNPVVAGLRYLTYRSFYVPAFSWYSPVLGVMLLGLVGFVYFMGTSELLLSITKYQFGWLDSNQIENHYLPV